jgi:hypothetical protein
LSDGDEADDSEVTLASWHFTSDAQNENFTAN